LPERQKGINQTFHHLKINAKMKKLIFLPLVLMVAITTSCNKQTTAAVEEAAAVTEEKAPEPSKSAEEQPKPANQQKAEERFARLDANKDGKLQKEEVKGRVAENFDAIDKDGDGALSFDELMAARARNRRPGMVRPGGGE